VPDVTACLVTRGDQPGMMTLIRRSLIFDRVIVWDNSRHPDWKTAGRYMAAISAETELVYWQDDDVLVPEETQRALVAGYEWPIVANYGHGDNPDGYDDLPLVCGGAVANRNVAWQQIARYAQHHPIDQAFMYEADFAVGVLYPSFKHLRLPFEINLEVAQHGSRLCNQPWQRDLKLDVTNRARAIRDAA
jgi:hypothetical protein